MNGEPNDKQQHGFYRRIWKRADDVRFWLALFALIAGASSALEELRWWPWLGEFQARALEVDRKFTVLDKSLRERMEAINNELGLSLKSISCDGLGARVSSLQTVIRNTEDDIKKFATRKEIPPRSLLDRLDEKKTDLQRLERRFADECPKG